MGEVVTVSRWGRVANKDNVIEKFASCDQFIRSKVVPPPIGSVVFTFRGGKVTITGDTTSIVGGDCDIVIRGNYVCINGCIEHAVSMFCSIHREIEEVAGVCQQVFATPQAGVA